MSQSPALNELVDGCIERLMKVPAPGTRGAFCLSDAEVRDLCRATQEIFRNQPTLLELEAPLFICGDIHGQYIDLLRIFEWGGLPPKASYLFLGDYVDRGQQSLETMCLLFCFKIKYPAHFYLLRGNHEAVSVNHQYGFYEECKRKLSIKSWKAFNIVFQFMPVAALIEDRIICMHGGLSPELVHVNDINAIERPTDIKNEGLLADLMWSDPSKEHANFTRNEERGIAQWFGREAVVNFLERNGLDLVCRAHQCVEDGYEFQFDMRLVTLFSAPNYCGDYDNSAAIMIIDENLTCSFQIFRPLERNRRFEAIKQELSKIREDSGMVGPGTPGQKAGFEGGSERLLEELSPQESKEQWVNPPVAPTEPQKLEKRRATGRWDLLKQI